MNRRILRTFLALAIASASLAGCASSPSDATDDSDGESALTVDQLRPVNSRPLVTSVPAVRADITGAKAWSLYAASAKELGSDGRAFNGVIAYGVDANNQAIWGLAIDRNDTSIGVAVQFESGPGTTRKPITLPPAVQEALKAELSNLRSALPSSQGSNGATAATPQTNDGMMSYDDAALLLNRTEGSDKSFGAVLYNTLLTIGEAGALIFAAIMMIAS